MSTARALLLAGGLLLVSSSLFVCGRVADRGRFAVPWSSYGAGPDGARGLFLLAQELGARPERWAQDLARLPAQGGMLVALSDCEAAMARPLSRYEQAELRRWVESGGVLLVAGAHHYLPSDFPIGFEPDPACPEEREPFAPEAREPPETHYVHAVAEPLRGLPPFLSKSEARLQLNGDGAVVLLERPALVEQPDAGVGEQDAGVPIGVDVDALAATDPTGAGALPSDVVGAAARLGRGHVIALASASPLQNRALLDHEGGALFARLLAHYGGGGPVLFDEYHLGLGTRRSAMRYLRQAGATPYVLQLLLVLGVLLLRAGARFGGVRPEPEPAPGGTASFVAALGTLFGRAHDASGTTQILARQALGRVAAHHHLHGLSAARLADQLRARGRAEAAEAVLAIARSGQLLAAAGYDLVELSRRLDAAVARACAEPTG